MCDCFECWADRQGPLDRFDIYAVFGPGQVAVFVADEEDIDLAAEILFKDGRLG